jgi:hypothetical protein
VGGVAIPEMGKTVGGEVFAIKIHFRPFPFTGRHITEVSAKA